MNKENNKQDYLAPTLKVVEFRVERGFALSTFEAQGLYDDQQMLFYDGTEEYQEINVGGWFNN